MSIAFPNLQPGERFQPLPTDLVGLTLRDYFAAVAVAAMDLQINIAGSAARTMAQSAYIVADAMLEARK